MVAKRSSCSWVHIRYTVATEEILKTVQKVKKFCPFVVQSFIDEANIVLHIQLTVPSGMNAINIEFGINQIMGRCNFTCIYHNNHHIKLSLLPLGYCWTFHGSFILTSFQHSPRCSLELINFKISSFLSSPLLFCLTSLSLLFVFLAIFCPPLERTKIPLREIAQ